MGSTLKINIDGAFLVQTWQGGLVIIIRDVNGVPLLTAWSTMRHCRNAEEAKALAYGEGVQLAATWQDCEFVLLEADRPRVVKLVQAREGRFAWRA